MIKALKKRYGFKKVTRSTLKHILYEGARMSRVLRINNSWFDKMIEVLNIKLEPESESEDDNQIEEEEKNETPEETK